MAWNNRVSKWFEQTIFHVNNRCLLFWNAHSGFETLKFRVWKFQTEPQSGKVDHSLHTVWTVCQLAPHFIRTNLFDAVNSLAGLKIVPACLAVNNDQRWAVPVYADRTVSCLQHNAIDSTVSYQLSEMVRNDSTCKQERPIYRVPLQFAEGKSTMPFWPPRKKGAFQCL